MFMYRTIVSLILLLFFYVKFSNNAALSPYEQRKYKDLIDGQGLYSGDDDVEILTKSNFKSRIYGQNNAWIVEFYNSWCGFCQRFAPSWKALASDILSWKDKLNIGAIDCSDDDNNEICRQFEIMAYPTVRYFHENYVEGPKKFGDDLQKGEDVAGHKSYLLAKLMSEQLEGRGKQFPNLLPYNYTNLNHLFEGISLNTKYVFLIVENDTRLGMEVALDLANISQIAIRYASTANDGLMKTIAVKKVPHMLVLSDTNESQQFADGLTSRESFKMAIQKFLQPKKIYIPNNQNTNIFTGKWLDSQVPDMNSLIEAREKKALRDKIKQMGDVVFQGDLETTLRYSLKHEIASANVITGEMRDALISFLDLIIKYFPLSEMGKTFVMEINEKVKSSDNVHGSELGDIVKRMENDDQKIFSSRQQWLACDGSSPKYRGYPCGLWKLFHYMTVKAAQKRATHTNNVLKTMHAYVKHFFGCADCSKHFQQMAEEKHLNDVSSDESAILWLWSAHNDVNKRLAKDTTEDPEFPKIQFPSSQRCPLCRNDDNSFNTVEVTKYLKNMYSSVNLRYIGADTTILLSGLGQPKNSNDTAFLKTVDATRVPEKDVRT